MCSDRQTHAPAELPRWCKTFFFSFSMIVQVAAEGNPRSIRKLVALSFQKQKLRWGAKHSPPAWMPGSEITCCQKIHHLHCRLRQAHARKKARGVQQTRLGTLSATKHGLYSSHVAQQAKTHLRVHNAASERKARGEGPRPRGPKH